MRWRRDPAAVAIAIVSALYIVLAIGSPLTGSTTFHATQFLNSYAPWQAAEANETTPANVCVSDTIDAVLPGRKVSADALRHGQIATYDPDNNGGSDTGASLGAGIYDPIVFAPYVALPIRVAPAFEKLLELLVAVLGMGLWARQLGMSRAAGLVGGMVYATCGFMVVWTNWPQTSVAAFVPMLFWALERLARRRDLQSVLLVTLPFGSMILGGFPALTGWCAYAGGAYLLMRLVGQRAGAAAVVRGLLGAAAAAAVAAAIAAFQLLPFVHDYVDQNLGYRSNQGLAILPKSGLLTALFPNALGTCAGGAARFAQPNAIEASVFVGTVAVVLGVLGLVGRSRAGVARGIRPFFVVVVLICLNQVYAHDFVERGIARLPVFSGNPDGRLHFLIGFCAAVFATFGVDRIAARAWRPRWWRHPRTILVAAVWAFAAAVGLFAALHARSVAASHHDGPHLDHGTTIAVAFGLIALVLILVAASVPKARTVACVAVAVLVAIQGASFARSFWPREPNSSFYPVTATHAFLAANLGENRTAGVDYALWSGTSSYYGLREVTGHSFLTNDYSDLLRAVDPTVFKSPTFTALTLTPSVVANPILNQLSVAYLVASPQIPAMGLTQPAATTAGSDVTLRSGSVISAPLGVTPLRSVGLILASPLSPGSNALPSVTVTLLNSAGSVVGTGTRRLLTLAGAGTFWVNVSDSDTQTGALTAKITLTDPGESATLKAAPTSATRQVSTPVPALDRITAVDDGLRIAFAGDSTVYQRLSSLPRIRWASQAVVVPAAAQVGALAIGISTNEVILNPGTTPEASGAGADVNVRTDTDTDISATVTGQGAGYLVVGDTAIPGWSATVDGHNTPILSADHGLQAVAVPTGTHTVTLLYHQRGLKIGTVITVISLVGYVGAWAEVLRRRRRGSSSRPRRSNQNAQRGAGTADSRPTSPTS